MKQPAAILETVDEQGELDSLPFMPEMVQFCGRTFVVSARAERVCDTITWSGTRTMQNTVLLEDLRCSGSGHGGCAAGCRIYWKTKWLEPAVEGDLPAEPAMDDPDRQRLLELVSRTAIPAAAGPSPRYRCQATQALPASAPLSPSDPRSYWREYRSGNVSLPRFVRVMTRAVAMEVGKKLHLLADIPLRGEGSASIRLPTAGLQAGEWVRVRTRAEIQATLNDKGRNKGLWFDREMLPFCGGVFQVRQRIDRIIDDRTGEMIELSSDCVSLDGVVCSGEHSVGRWFCPRAIFPYWREGWLERIDAPIVTESVTGGTNASGC